MKILQLPTLRNWQWLPCRRFGPIIFNAPIETLPPGFLTDKLIWSENDPEHNQYQVHETAIPGLFLSEEDGIIQGALCESEFWVNGENLIGQPIAVAQRVLATEPSEIDEWDLAVQYSFEKVGLMIGAELSEPRLVGSVTVSY